MITLNISKCLSFSNSPQHNIKSKSLRLLSYSNSVKSFSKIMSSFQMADDDSPLLLSPTYILQDFCRPQLKEVNHLASIPVIDLNDENGDDPSSLDLKISNACEEYGFFHVINHGVSQDLCNRMLASVNDFYYLPSEERRQYLTTDHSKKIKIFHYYYKVDQEGQEIIKMWGETFTHPWHPVDDFSHLLPKNPPQYRKLFAEYSREIGGLMDKVMGLISRSLGLEKDCLKKRIGERPSLSSQSNYYPQCSEPERTMGLGAHTDLGLLTVLLQSQGVNGLQVFKDRHWIAVDPIPGSLVINLADQLQVLTNGRYKSVWHRAVTNSLTPRVSLAMFYAPNEEAMIGPMDELVSREHPRIYKTYGYKEFMEHFYKNFGRARNLQEFELPRKN